jgi:two-component system OmpR family sensor kinase
MSMSDSRQSPASSASPNSFSRRSSVIRRLRSTIWRVPVGLQLSALYTLLLVATLALLGWALYAQLDQFLVKNTADRLDRAVSTVLSPDSGFYRGGPPRRDAGRHFDAPGPPGLPSSTSSSPDADSLAPVVSFLVRDLSAPDVTVAVLDDQGKAITSTQALNGTALRALPALPDGWLDKVKVVTDTDVNSQTEQPAQPKAQWVVASSDGGRQLVVVQPIDVVLFPQGTQQTIYLLQAASLDAADAILGQLRLYLVLGVLIGTVVGVFAGLALTRTVLKPLDRMVGTAEAIAGGDLNRRLRMPVGRNEVARLGSAFDHMVDRLAATLHAQRRFVADASHELRTPLTSLEGLSEMLLIGADRGDSSAVQRMARSMHHELQRMARLVSDLLTLSRLDSAAPMSFTTVDANTLLNNVAEQMAPLAEARQIRLEVAANGPVPVRADPDRLKQVVLNLVDNALRYTPVGGDVKLAATQDSIARVARIEVRDNGPGIPPEDLPHIFDRFYRGDPSRTRASGNTGLGLAIVNAIVQAHSGRIEVESSPGNGTCFKVILPSVQTEANDSGKPTPAAIAPKREYQAASKKT